MIRGKEYLIFTAAYQTPKPHRHLGLHLLFALEGALDCRVEGQEIACAGICIDSNVCHTAQVPGKPGRALVVLVERTSLMAHQIRRQFLWTGHGYRDFAVLPQEFIERVRKASELPNCEDVADAPGIPEYMPPARRRDFCGKPECARQADLNGKDEAGVSQIIRTLGGRCEPETEISDQRILAVLAQIQAQQAIDGDIYKELSRTACLSQSRLSHLFKEQVGVSLAGYLTWAKLEKACMLIQAGERMTDAAVNAGFSSSSHLSATFRRMFGITCSEFLNSF